MDKNSSLQRRSFIAAAFATYFTRFMHGQSESSAHPASSGGTAISMSHAELRIIQQIGLQKARYCRYLDTKQFDAWEKLFAPDAHIRFLAPDASVLLEANFPEFATMTRQLFATTTTVHQVHNAEISFAGNGNHASAIWAMEDWHRYTPTPERPQRSLHGYGHYYESWQHVDGQWLIKKIELYRSILDLT